MRLLLEHHARTDLTDKWSNAPLHIAAMGGHDAAVKLLLEFKANPNQPDEDGYTPLHHAAFKG